MNCRKQYIQNIYHTVLRGHYNGTRTHVGCHDNTNSSSFMQIHGGSHGSDRTVGGFTPISVTNAYDH